jgi:hypothetical protein
MYATYACVNRAGVLPGFGARLELDESAWDKTADGCDCDFVELLPPLGEDLPNCPHCGGPSKLVAVLAPSVAG